MKKTIFAISMMLFCSCNNEKDKIAASIKQFVLSGYENKRASVDSFEILQIEATTHKNVMAAVMDFRAEMLAKEINMMRHDSASYAVILKNNQENNALFPHSNSLRSVDSATVEVAKNSYDSMVQYCKAYKNALDTVKSVYDISDSIHKNYVKAKVHFSLVVPGSVQSWTFSAYLDSAFKVVWVQY